MKIKSKITQRVGLGKGIGLIFGGFAFFIIPMILNNTSLFLRFGVWLWYITLGALIGIFGVMDNYPYLKLKIPFWFRGIMLGGWMNFVISLIAYNELKTMMVGTAVDGYSPFCIVIGGMIFGLLTDYIATKYIGEGKDLLKEKK
ncbi:MAG: hypothetical protein WC850_06500 [Candidatus Gracilibacteria bacterium]